MVLIPIHSIMFSKQFGQHRLLTFDRDPVTRSPTIEIAHEALVNQWDRFGHWIEENRLSLMARQRLSTSTREWLEHGRDSSYLASGARLIQFEDLTQDSAVVLTTEERNYIDMSIGKRQQVRRRVQVFVAMLAVISVVAVIAAILAVQGQNQAEEARQSAVGRTRPGEHCGGRSTIAGAGSHQPQ